MASNNLHTAMDKYFLYKENYESKIAKEKKQILNNELLDEVERKIRVASVVPKCINCKRPVGTTFSETDRTFKAVCGDISEPCALNIEFKLGKKEHYDDIILNASETVNDLKEQIIHLKADLIYGYKAKSEITDEFTKIKAEYNSFQNILESIIVKKHKLLKKDKKVNKSLNDALNENITNIKNNVNTYSQDNDPIHITNNVQIYNNDIKIILTDIMNNKYENKYVKKQTDTHGDVFSLIQETTRLNDLYVSKFKDDSSELINYAT